MGEKAIELNETPVGCVLIYHDQIGGFGMKDTIRRPNRTKHAKLIAVGHMLQSYPRSALRFTDLYVAVEPRGLCYHIETTS